MSNKSIAYLLVAFSFLMTAAVQAADHLYLLPGDPPSETDIRSWQVAVAGYSPDGIILFANELLGNRLLSSQPRLVDLGVWEEGKPRLIIPAKQLSTSITPLYRTATWALVDNADEVLKAHIHGLALERGRPFVPLGKTEPMPQTKPSRILPGLASLLAGITSTEIQNWVNTLVAYQTRFSPSVSGHQAAEDMANTLAGWGYNVTRWHYIYPGFSDIYRDGNSIWTCGNPDGNTPLGTLFHSSDNGTSFSEVELPEANRAMINRRIVASGSHVLLAQSSVLLVSHNNGVTWNAVSPGENNQYRALHINGNEAWCLTYDGKLYHSLDFGDNWVQVSFPAAFYHWSDLDVSGNTIIVGGSGGLYVSNDGGGIWTPTWQSPGRVINRLQINGNEVWVACNDGLVVHSTNGFSQYQTMTLGENSFFALAFLGTRGLIAGDSGTLYRTLNNGATWQKVSMGTESRLSGLEFTASGLGLVGGSSGTIMESGSNLDGWQSIVDRFDPTASAVWTNIIAEKPGITRPGEVVMASAHLDSIVWGGGYDPWTLAPGADDNGTGSATVLALANAFREYPTGRTLRFVLFTGEEEGLIGSSRYAYWLQSQGQDVQAVYNLDMTGYDANSNSISQDLVGNRDSQWMVDYAVSCANQYAPGFTANRVINPLDTWSDHAYFWFLGIPALCSIESEDVRYDNPYYHSPQDTTEHINFEQSYKACLVAGATIGELSQPGDSPLPGSLADLKVYPNPFRPGLGQQLITFENVPVGSKIEIYDLAGNRVMQIAYTDGYRVTWEGKSSSGERLASGVYLYRVSAPQGAPKTGKLAILN